MCQHHHVPLQVSLPPKLVELPLKEKLLLIITAALDQRMKQLTQGAQGNQGGVKSLSERDMNSLKYMQKLTVMYQMLWVWFL